MAIQKTSSAMDVSCFEAITSKPKTLGLPPSTSSQRGSSSSPNPANVSGRSFSRSLRAATRPKAQVVPTRSSELARKTQGRYATPTRLRKNVSATFLTETSLQPSRKRAAAPQAKTRPSPGWMPSFRHMERLARTISPSRQHTAPA